ncbi:MAG: polysaccharide deacetylase family protein [Candidatus Thiodiazotropha sp.]|jgi:peptidoglycan/xylan/chitin deacetylase (PgdA/CDA1 family)
MRKIKVIIKNLVAYFLYYSGILSLIKNYKLKNKICVLAYHRVIPENMLNQVHSASGIITEKSLFQNHLRWLKQEFDIIAMDDMYDFLSNHKSISCGCMLTFDDGWHDNYFHAKELLEQENIPATVFLPFDYINSNTVFWQEELLARLLYLNDSNNSSDISFLEQVIGSEAKQDRHTLRGFVTKLKDKEYSEIEAILDSLRRYQKDSKVTLEHDAYLTWKEVLEMLSSNISFGSHSMSHRMLTRIASEEVQYEITESKVRIEEKIGRPVNAIAYPNGNSNSMVQDVVAESNYRLGFRIDHGYVSKDSNPMALPRINIHSGNSRNKPILLCTILKIF